jgi:5-methylcytosine-specific restriction endonuclease McrA
MTRKRLRTDKRYGSPRWRKLTRTIQARDAWACRYCGGPSQLTDHILAVVHGGDFWDPANLAACCRSCNQGRRQNGDAWQPHNRPRPVAMAGPYRVLRTDYSRKPSPRIG